MTISQLARELWLVSQDDPILTQAERVDIENAISDLEACLRSDDVARLERQEHLARTVA